MQDLGKYEYEAGAQYRLKYPVTTPQKHKESILANKMGEQSTPSIDDRKTCHRPLVGTVLPHSSELSEGADAAEAHKYFLFLCSVRKIRKTVSTAKAFQKSCCESTPEAMRWK